ncbi:MAG: segregation/condensation protein A [Dethiosulfovibrio peptidovorans]|nr:MAG: segregation/condensation protein A [Dethiosulfovibrio peptidovorans]
MLESREIEASRVSVAHVVRVYGEYHARRGEFPIDVVANFLVQAARLVLEKALALMPRVSTESEEILEEEPPEIDLEALLTRYRPYRKAALVLQDLRARGALRAFRTPHPLPPTYDLGDLYSLSMTWWTLVRAKFIGDSESLDDGWDTPLTGIPEPIPDENQVERRMEWVLSRLPQDGIPLSNLLGGYPSVSTLVVTILALLELSRRDRVRLIQEERFGEVLVIPQ